MCRPGRVAAIYARVSSDRQRREQTIQSQTVALRELAVERGLLVSEDLVFEDEGVSGAVLRRPALERLRDLAVEGRFEVVLCLAPDRLARRYAYQVLLLEEFQRTGVQVIFAKEPERSGTPEDELLRQFQGMIAEYERAQIAERCRRGKLHRARGGAVSVMARAPYGYRYVKRTEHADAVFEIDEAEAPVVREIFRRYLEEDESIQKIARWLAAQGVATRTGKTGWNTATLWGMLRNPAYAGQAAYGKTHAASGPVRPTRQARLRGQRSTRVAREGVAADEWKTITVPALVSAEQFALVAQRLERNGRISPRNTKRPSLLQGIVVCRECGYAYYRCSTRSKNGTLREYYRCSGTDGHRRPEGRVCENRPIRLGEVAELVWARVLALLQDPTLIKAEIDRRLQTMRATHPATGRRDALERDLTRARAGLRRLLDGYQEQLITLEELRARTPELRQREGTLQAQLDALDAELHDAESYLKLTETLDAFRSRLSTNAASLTIEQRQQIIRLVVREILIGEDDITIRHSIPIPTDDQRPGYLLRSGSREVPDPGVGSHPAVVADQARAGRHDAHDDKRNGTTSLYAALEIATGEVTGSCYPQHTHQEFLAFLNQLVRAYPRRPLHVVLDNSSTHSTAEVKRWLERHPRVHFHFTPTSASWMNMVEIWFSILTKQQVRRGVYHDVPELIAAIKHFIDGYNDRAQPFVWTKTPDQILDKAIKRQDTSETLH